MLIDDAAVQLRQILIEQVAQIPDASVGVFLSSGIDSLSVALAATHAGKSVEAYTFKVKGRPSQDADIARLVCNRFGWKFNLFVVDPSHIINDIYPLRDQHKCVRKTHFECVWPFLRMMRSNHKFHKYILSGVCADGHFGLSKKAMIHYRYPQEKFNQFRREYFAKTNAAGVDSITSVVAASGCIHVPLYVAKEVISLLQQFSWDELNKPQQKQIIRTAFSKDIGHMKVPKHLNLQLGAGIDESFTCLLQTSVNKHKRKRVLDLLRDFVRSA